MCPAGALTMMVYMPAGRGPVTFFGGLSVSHAFATEVPVPFCRSQHGVLVPAISIVRDAAAGSVIVKASLSPAGEIVQVTSPPHAMGSELSPLVSCVHTLADSGSVVLVVLVLTVTVVLVAPASVVVLTASVVVVDVPLTWHASQQLGDVPARPPLVAQRAALFIGLQPVPRQHATAPDRPHVE